MRSQRGPVASPRRVRRQDAGQRAGVVQLAAQHGLVGLVQVNPADRHTAFLALAAEPLAGVDLGEISGQEDAQGLGVSTRRTEVVDELVPATGAKVGLLVKLARSAQPGRLPCHVEQTSRQLPLERTDRVAVLLDEQDLVTAIDLAQRQDCHGTRVVDILASDVSGFSEVHGVAPDIPDHALKHDGGSGDGTSHQPVGQVEAAKDRSVQTHCVPIINASRELLRRNGFGVLLSVNLDQP